MIRIVTKKVYRTNRIQKRMFRFPFWWSSDDQGLMGPFSLLVSLWLGGKGNAPAQNEVGEKILRLI